LTGGYIIQQVTVMLPGGWSLNYWEAWQVYAGNTYTVLHMEGWPYDDLLQAAGVHGTSFSTSARYYDNINLPSTFINGNCSTFGGSLPSTTMNPNLPTNTATPPVVRSWTNTGP
jgi:hypothetical protein